MDHELERGRAAYARRAWAEAHESLARADASSPLPAEEVALADALGRVLAVDVVAPLDVPGFDRSNVDGFAVHAEDTFGASEDQPRTLRLNPEVLATGVEPQVPVPDLVLYLVADVGTCMERIRKRQRSVEKTIFEEYIAELIDAYNHYYHYYSRSPLLVVDTRFMNFPGRQEDFDELLHRLARPIKGTEYFQPLGSR